MWHPLQKCACVHGYCPNGLDVEHLREHDLEGALLGERYGDQMTIASGLMAPYNAYDASSNLTKEEYEARVNKLQVIMKDLQAAAPHDDHQGHAVDSESSSLANRLTFQAEELCGSYAPIAQNAVMTSRVAAAARHPQMGRDETPSQVSFRPAAPPAISFFKAYTPSPQAPKALGEAGGDAVDGAGGLQRPWGSSRLQRESSLGNVAADSAEKQVLEMLAAESNDGLSESSAQSRVGRLSSIDSQDLGQMLDEVKRLDQMRALEADPQEKAELKRQMQAEMKALLAQVQKAKAQVLQAETKVSSANLQDGASYQQASPKIFTERKVFEEKKDTGEKLVMSENRKEPPQACVRNCMVWPGSSS